MTKNPQQDNRGLKILSDEEYETVKQLYIEQQSVRSIAKAYNIPYATLQKEANKRWRAEKEMMKAQLFSEFTATKRSNFVKMSQAAIQVMTRALENQASSNRPPTLKEATDAVKILEALDKITRLDDGNPTDITAEKAVSFKDIEAVYNLNPFKTKEIEDADYEEINEDDNDGGDIPGTPDSH